MKRFKNRIQAFYVRDLDKLADEIDKLPESQLWEHPVDVNNSCGVLAQHMIGNLNHYIGAGMGNTDYNRDREGEFTHSDLSRRQLISNINDTAEMIQNVLGKLESERMDEDFPFYDSEEFTVGEALIHLYGHFNYHLGQVNYLRRILRENK